MGLSVKCSCGWIGREEHIPAHLAVCPDWKGSSTPQMSGEAPYVAPLTVGDCVAPLTVGANPPGANSMAANNVKVFNPLEHGIHGQPLMVPAYEYNRLAAELAAAKAEAEKQAAEWEQQFEKTFDACSKRIAERDVAIARAKEAEEAREKAEAISQHTIMRYQRTQSELRAMTGACEMNVRLRDAARAENARLVGLLREAKQRIPAYCNPDLLLRIDSAIAAAQAMVVGCEPENGAKP